MLTVLKDPNFWMLVFYVVVLAVVTIGIVSAVPGACDRRSGIVPSHWDKRKWWQRLCL